MNICSLFADVPIKVEVSNLVFPLPEMRYEGENI